MTGVVDFEFSVKVGPMHDAETSHDIWVNTVFFTKNLMALSILLN